MHQKFFSSLQRAALKHIGIDGEISLRQASGLLQAQATRNRQAMLGRGGDKLCVSASGQERTNLIADGPFGHARTHFGNDPCPLQPRQITGTCRGVIKAGTLQRIGPIDPGISQGNHHLPMTCARTGTRGDLQHVSCAGRRNFNSRHLGHRCPPLQNCRLKFRRSPGQIIAHLGGLDFSQKP